MSGNNLFEVGTTISSFKVSPGNHFGFDFYKGATATDPLSRAITDLLAHAQRATCSRARGRT